MEKLTRALFIGIAIVLAGCAPGTQITLPSPPCHPVVSNEIDYGPVSPPTTRASLVYGLRGYYINALTKDIAAKYPSSSRTGGADITAGKRLQKTVNGRRLTYLRLKLVPWLMG